MQQTLCNDKSSSRSKIGYHLMYIPAFSGMLGHQRFSTKCWQVLPHWQEAAARCRTHSQLVDRGQPQGFAWGWVALLGPHAGIAVLQGHSPENLQINKLKLLIHDISYKMAVILQTSSNSFSSFKIIVFGFKFHRNLLPFVINDSDYGCVLVSLDR